MRRDLAMVVAFACLALVAAVLPPPVWLRATLLIPLVLVLPGYAVGSLLFPPRSVSPAERGVYTVGLSIAIAAVGGLLIQLVLGLDRGIWAAFLAVTTIVAGLWGLDENRDGVPLSLKKMPRSLPVALAVFLIAAVVAGMAIDSAGDGLRKAEAEIHFTDFWLLPDGNAGVAPNAETLSVGLRSHEDVLTHYTLQLSRESVPFATESLTLDSGEKWERDFAVTKAPRGVPVVATLSRDGVPYRNLNLMLAR